MDTGENPGAGVEAGAPAASAAGSGESFTGTKSQAPQQDCDPALETAVLLDSIIHDLRTPLSAMSGWLEVLEAHFGEVDGIVGRALTGLRRGVDSQTEGLNGLSDVLMKQRIDIPAMGECQLLERMQLALRELEGRKPPLDAAVSDRLAPIRVLNPASSLTCQDAGSSLNDAFGTFLHALALSQQGADAPLSVSSEADKVLITVPGGSGDLLPIKSLCHGLSRPCARRSGIQAQAIWLARSMLQRCGVALQMIPSSAGGFSLLLSRSTQP